ncbi:ABC transporter permease [Hydrogenibacillus sp. N12]|uniref:ABC transporter permease n=1 Tax=Hydrogenibacillus sp. N12 TaxID=2866627 RepID=UPI001C7D2561|nr:ABC transporter permease [Hydrogenibacillus sp. N12]QZA34034.1 ABC transporter permease [Hydrogenibacillus sp. N12]
MALRLAYIVLVAWLALTGVFFLVAFMPGDAAYSLAVSIAQERNISLEQAMELAHRLLGYEPRENVWGNYWSFFQGLVRGDFGYSIYFKTPVRSIIAEALPWTLLVISGATLVSFFLGAYIGAVAAQKRGTVWESLITGGATLFQAMPPFILALVILFLFSVRLHWLPLGGAYPIDVTPEASLTFVLSVLRHAAGPLMATALPQLASWTLAMRGNTTQVLGEDFIRFAEVRGLKDRTIAGRYIRTNALLPLVASLAIGLGYMLGGHTLVETVFNYPGIGFYFAKAIAVRDYGLMTGLFSLIVIGVLLATVLADAVYALIDPRVRKR